MKKYFISASIAKRIWVDLVVLIISGLLVVEMILMKNQNFNTNIAIFAIISFVGAMSFFSLFIDIVIPPFFTIFDKKKSEVTQCSLLMSSKMKLKFDEIKEVLITNDNSILITSYNLSQKEKIWLQWTEGGDKKVIFCKYPERYREKNENYIIQFANSLGVKYENISVAKELDRKRMRIDCDRKEIMERKKYAKRINTNGLLMTIFFSSPGCAFLFVEMHGSIKNGQWDFLSLLIAAAIMILPIILLRNKLLVQNYYDERGLFSIGFLGLGRVLNVIDWSEVKEIGAYVYRSRYDRCIFYVSNKVLPEYFKIENDKVYNGIIQVPLNVGTKDNLPKDLPENMQRLIRKHIKLKMKKMDTR